jgi:methane/ammonia monooxygenase subunit B
MVRAMDMRKRIASALLLGLIASLSTAVPASAHGEAAQEAFLRMRSVGWIDVEFSDTEILQGETVTVTGTAKIMDTWPDTLAAGEPRIGFITIIAPGPVVALKERTVNGISTPGRIEVAKGDYYEFEMTFAGRRVGRWHIHPGFAVKGAGTLIGPGQFITVNENPDGYSSALTLYNGDEINLENYQISFVWIWQIITFLIGMGWMLYWTVPKFHRTVTNLAVTSQIPLNDDGVEVGLNFKKDHRVVNLFALGTALLLAVGFLYQANAFPVKIPQQVIQFEPPPIEPSTDTLTAGTSSAAFDTDANELTLTVDVTNEGDSSASLSEFQTSNLTFVTGTPTTEAESELGVEGTTEIAPGATETLRLTAADPRFAEENLIPIGEAQLQVAGLLIFEDSAGDRSIVEVDAPITPTFE